jgi:type VI secretion system protein ImpH
MAAESGLESIGLTPDEPAQAPLMVAELLDPAAVSSRAHDSRWAEIRAALRNEPNSFGFFQTVRLLERIFPGRLHVGGYDDPAREVVRFGVLPTLAFPASEIQELTLGEAGARMKVNFIGLTGPLGVLPHPYTQLVADRLRLKDAALADFFDLFHHRITSLFYLAWRKYRFTVAREEDTYDRQTEHALDLIGLGLDGYRNRLPFPDEALTFRAGLLLPQPRGAAALEQLLHDFFQVPVEVIQFVGSWYTLSRTDLCEVGGAEDDPANQLGNGAVAGDEMWDQQARVRVRLGPLDRAHYDSFLPGGSGYISLAALLRFFSHDQFEFELQLVLEHGAVPGLRLDGAGMLGWSSWIASTPLQHHADQTILTLQHGAAS